VRPNHSLEGGPGNLMLKHEMSEIWVARQAFEEAIPGRSARSL